MIRLCLVWDGSPLFMSDVDTIVHRQNIMASTRELLHTPSGHEGWTESVQYLSAGRGICCPQWPPSFIKENYFRSHA